MPNQRARQKAATLQRLKAEARVLFERRGFSRVGIRDVCAAAGNSTGAVFANFPHKEALFHAAMGREAPDPAKFAHAVIEAESLGDAVEAALQFLRDWEGSEP